MVRDVLLGREVDPERIPTEAMWALTGVYGIDKYSTDKYLKEGKVTEYVVNLFTPATPIIDGLFKGGKEFYDFTQDEEVNLEPTLKAIPLVGPIVYNWFGGGAEKYNERLDD